MTPANPLFIEGVVSNIFSFLPSSDIQNCRQVCEFWRTEAWINSTKRKTIVFVNEEELKAYIALIEHVPLRRPFEKYVFGCGHFSTFGPQPTATVGQFFQQFCSSIRSLDMHALQNVPSILNPELQAKLVNLQSLAVNTGQVELPLRIPVELESLTLYFALASNKNFNSTHPEIVVSILNAFLQHSGRGLKSLSLHSAAATGRRPSWELSFLNREMSKELSRAIIAYAKASGRPGPPLPLSSIQSFHYNFPFDSSDLTEFPRAVKFPALKSLALQLDDPYPSPRALCAFLDTYSGIEKLNIHCLKWYNQEVALQAVLFPSLERLMELTMRGFRGELEFLQTCPNLREVKLLEWRANFQAPFHLLQLPLVVEDPNDGPPLAYPSVTSAIINPIGFPHMRMVLTYVTCRFPNLTWLQFDANINVSDQKICSDFIMQHLPQLKKLHVKKLSDPLFDGLTD